MDIAAEKKYSFVVDTTAVQTLIKKTIAEDLTKGVKREVTYKKLKAIIKRFCMGIKAIALRREFETILAANSVKWYSTFSSSVGNILSIPSPPGINGGKFLGGGFNIPNRPYLSDNPKGLAIIEDYQKKVRRAYEKAVRELAQDEAKTISSGSLRNIAECRVRFEANMGDLAAMRAAGVKLVWISSHADCSKRCEPWQGRLYSLDDTTGTKDGYSYIPIERAMLGEKGDGNGILSGYNCRHRAVPYKDGSVAPEEYGVKEIQKERKIDQKQRYMERRIREVKQQAFIIRSNDGKAAQELFKKAREMTDAYRKFSEENGRAAFIYRTQVMREN